MNILESIKTRRSNRTFLDTKLPETAVNAIKALIAGVSEETVRFFYVAAEDKNSAAGKTPGTYGVIKNPQGYIAGTCRNTREDLLTLGRLLEKIILELTGRTMGTCWLAGTFNRDSWKKEIDLPEGHILPVIIPVGFPSKTKRLTERLMRGVIRADNRKPREQLFFKGDFTRPLAPKEGGPWETPLEMVRLAPSASNKQPWRLVLSPDNRECRLYLEESPAYNNGLGFPVQIIDMGIAMCHLEEACRAEGLQGSWVTEDPAIPPLTENTDYIATYRLS